MQGPRNSQTAPGKQLAAKGELLQKKVSLSHPVLKILIEHIDEGIVVLDADHKIEFGNTAFRKFVNVPAENLVGRSIYDVFPSQQHAILNRIFDDYLKSAVEEISLLGKNGTQKLFHMRYKILKNRKEGKIYCLFLKDISQIHKIQKKNDEKVKRLMSFDMETGLYNREYFEMMLANFIKTSKENFSIIKIELDRVDMIATILTLHDGVSPLLKQIAENIQFALGARLSVIARLGDYRLGVLIKYQQNPIEIIETAKKILSIVRQPYYINEKLVYPSTSLGISLFPHDGKEMQGLMKQAEDALLYVKRQGGNHYQFSTPSIEMEASIRLDLEAMVREALQHNKFLLYYQPKVSLSTGKIVALEALIRLKDDFGDFIPPKLFLDVAEETFLINPIGEWVLREVAENYMKANLALPVSVNLSVNQLKPPYDLLGFVNRIVDEYNIDLSLLELEITESAFLEDQRRILDILTAFKKKGIKIAIDDFGVGYSSFAYLKNFKPYAIKIDKSFIDTIVTDSTSAEILKAINTLGHGIGSVVIAEGVETKEQVQFLKRVGCDQIQGFYFSKAVSLEEIKEMVINQKKLQ